MASDGKGSSFHTVFALRRGFDTYILQSTSVATDLTLNHGFPFILMSRPEEGLHRLNGALISCVSTTLTPWIDGLRWNRTCYLMNKKSEA